MKAFWAFDEIAYQPGAIDALHKQLMALAVALTTQCPIVWSFIARLPSMQVRQNR